jgi:hypothetical protein
MAADFGLGGSKQSVFGTIVVLGIVYTAVQRIRGWYRLRHIKGPVWAAFTDFWLIKSTWSGRMYLELARVCDKYGKCHCYKVRCGGLKTKEQDPSYGLDRTM